MRHIFKANKIYNKNIQYSKDYLYTFLFTQLAKKKLFYKKVRFQ